jgi:DNA-binding NtrC family response regulator
MRVNVLVVDNDSGLHELVNDMLHINYKDVAVDRVRDMDSFRAKVATADQAYDIVIFDGYPPDIDLKKFMDSIKHEFPAFSDKIIMICGSDCPVKPSQCRIPCLIKPFSLDEFGEIVKKIHAV